MKPEEENVKKPVVAKVAKPEVPTPEVPTSEPRMRQIIIETDGNKIRVVKAEVAGDLEFKAILETILGNFVKQ